MARWFKKFHLPKLGNPSADRAKVFVVPTFWGVSDPKFVEQIKVLCEEHVFDAGVHFADNMLTWCRNNSMLEDEAFVNAWWTNVESESDKTIVWRRYILSCAAYHCVHLKGDFVECGAYTGVGVKTVVDYLGAEDFPKNFWIYDLFEHDATMAHHSMPAHGPDLEGHVRAKFSRYPQVKIFKGNIPAVFGGGQCPKRIAYLHIDLNQAPAEIAALDALFDRVVPGGIVILDDYEWAGVYRGQKLAEDPWFESRGYRVFPLPTGQGIVVKR
jgi:O-methyltransferase